MESTYRRPLRYWSKRAPARRWDVLVVGSGLGGMVCAASLARLGHAVLLLEQHYVPGGMTHTFKRRGFTWRVAPHATGPLQPTSVAGRAVQSLTDHCLRWERATELTTRHSYPDGVDIPWPTDRQAFRAELVNRYPDAASDIDAYLNDIAQVHRRIGSALSARALPGKTGSVLSGALARTRRGVLHAPTGDVLVQRVANRQLRNVLSADWILHGQPPSKAAWGLHAALADARLQGGWRLHDDGDAIRWHLLRQVAEHGGWTRIVADVDEILVEHGQARGVRLVNGEEILAPTVVSAVGASATVERLLPETEAHRAWLADLNPLEPSAASVSLYIGYQGSPQELGIDVERHVCLDTWDQERGIWQIDARRPDRIAPPPAMTIHFPNATAAGSAHALHTATATAWVPWEGFSAWRGTPWRKRGPGYDELKRDLTDQMLSAVLHRYPKLREHILTVELGTPLTTEWFCRAPRGGVHGLAITESRLGARGLRPETPIQGVYLTGSDITVPGTTGAIWSGLLTAAAIEPVRIAAWLSRVRTLDPVEAGAAA